MLCPLCYSDKITVKEQVKTTSYLRCDYCATVFMHPESHVSEAAEKQRYLEHNNDVENLGYQKFVAPIVKAVTKHFNNDKRGLDFGAGTGPVITKLLENKGFSMALWDPFFHPNEAVLKTTYDFIVCCEVIEHFHHPAKEFKRLYNLLKPGGLLFCKTDMLPKTPLKDWYYATDPTHVIFYSQENLQWIQSNFNFSEVKITGRLIIFSK